MKIKEIMYKGTSLATNNAFNIVMQDESKTARLRTNYFDLQNFHGTRSTRTLGSGRIYMFKGYIYGATYEERQIGIDKLNELIIPEGLPSETNKGFHELSWYDWNGYKYKSDVKVITMPTYKHTVNEPLIEFEFELFSDLFWYYGYEDKTVSSTGVANLYGVEFETEYPVEYGTIGNTIQVTNSGNFIAPCEVRLVGSLENPRIVNNTNSTIYRLNGTTTTDLIVDNRGDTLIVEDAGVNVSKYRATGSKTVFLQPGLNNISVFGDNINESLAITISYNDTFIGG